LLTFDVTTSTPPEAMEVRNELLTESPYLSDTVMKSAVIKEDVLNNSMIRDVLVSNPQSAKSEELMDMLENRTVPMPDYMMEQILQGEDTVSAKEILEAMKAWWDGEASKAYTRLLNHYKGDSVTPANEDSLNWLFTYRNTLSSQYDKAGWFYVNGEYSQTQDVLNAIPSAFALNGMQTLTHDAYLDFYQLAEEFRSDTSYAFSIDSAMTSSLYELTTSNSDLPGTFARNILLAKNKISYQEPVILPDSGLKDVKKGKFRGVKESATSGFISVFPNPAHDYFVVRINLPETPVNGLLKLYDGKGRIVHSNELLTPQDQITISVANLSSGLYLLELESNSKKMGTVKIAITR
jgi:hypothetical protein